MDHPNSPEITTAFDDFMKAFDSFKQANDERLTQLETRTTASIASETRERVRASIPYGIKSMDSNAKGISSRLVFSPAKLIDDKGFTALCSKISRCYRSEVPCKNSISEINRKHCIFP